jgi:peptide/nickel transport system substrate-binding protein
MKQRATMQRSTWNSVVIICSALGMLLYGWQRASLLAEVPPAAAQKSDASQGSAQGDPAAEKAAPAASSDQDRGRVKNIAAMPAFDRVYLKGRKEPLTVHATLPRPFSPAMFRRGETVKLRPFKADRPDSGSSIGIRADEITKVELFEELLLQEGDRAMARRDFAGAFDCYARLVKMNSTWPAAKEKLFNVFHQQAEHALEQDPPDFDTAIGLCIQLRAEDRKALGVQSLLRRACLGRADVALQAGDFLTAREHLDLFLKNYPSDSEATRFQTERFVGKARTLVEEAQRAMAGDLEQQRKAVGLLLSARHVWPDTPDIDKLIDRAKRNYLVLQVAIFEPPGTFEPLGAESLTDWQACQLLFDWLFEPDESGGQFIRGPMLGPNGWSQSALGMKHDFSLDRSLRWADGKQVTAYDVEHSIKLWLDPGASNFDPERSRFIGDVMVRHPFELSVELKRPHPRPLSLFSLPVLPQHVVPEPPQRGSEFSRAPIGTGPFLVGTSDSPEQTKFVSNPAFRGASFGQPYIKEINFQHYVKSSAAARDVETNKAHLMTRLDPLETIRFAKLTGQFEVRSYLSNSVYWLGLNHRRKPLDDHRVRRAMLLAIDRQAILTQYFQAGPGGLAHRVITGPFPTHSPAYDSKVPVLSKDESLARQLIEEARKANRLPNTPLILKYPLGDSAVEKAASQIKKDLQKIGLEVRTEAKIESDLRNEVIDQQDFDIVYWRYDHRNVLYNIAPLLDAEQQQPGGTNFMGYQSPELLKLFSYLRQEQRPFELWEIQREIHRFIHREVVLIPLWQLDNYIAYTSKLLFRQQIADGAAQQVRQLPIHPLYLFHKTEGWYLEPSREPTP